MAPNTEDGSGRKASEWTSLANNAGAFLGELRVALRSLRRTPALWITVALTLALGIGANAAIFSIVRGVLLRPLVNRDEDRLIYIQQSAPGLQVQNTTFSIPEIQDIDAHLKTISHIGTFSTIDFSVEGLGDPREIHAGVVDGDYFEVMGLHPVLGRLLDARDDGPKAAGAVVLGYHDACGSQCAREGDPARQHVAGSLGDHRRGSRALDPLPGGHGNHRQHRHQPASPVGNDGARPRAPHDGCFRPAGPGGKP